MKTETMFETLIGLHRDGKSLTNPLQAVVIAREHDTYLGGPPIWLQTPVIASSPLSASCSGTGRGMTSTVGRKGD